MTLEELLEKIIEILKELEIPYAITGGFGVSVWGNPRSTNDIDIIVEMVEKNVKPLIKKITAINKNIYADEDMVIDALLHKSEFNFVDPDIGFKMDFFVLADNTYNKLKIKRAILREVFGVTKAYFVSPEDLILGKLVWSKESYSEKQMEDIKTVLKNKKIKLDFKYLKMWATKHGTTEVLENLIKEIKK
jgi:predicted nucleotidyltransferase